MILIKGHKDLKKRLEAHGEEINNQTVARLINLRISYPRNKFLLASFHESWIKKELGPSNLVLFLI